MMAVAVVVRTGPEPVGHRICPLIPTVQVAGVVSPNDWVLNLLPSVRQLITTTFGQTPRFSDMVSWIDPCSCFVVVVNVKVSTSGFIVGLLPAVGQKMATVVSVVSIMYHHFVNCIDIIFDLVPI